MSFSWFLTYFMASAVRLSDAICIASFHISLAWIILLGSVVVRYSSLILYHLTISLLAFVVYRLVAMITEMFLRDLFNAILFKSSNFLMVVVLILSSLLTPKIFLGVLRKPTFVKLGLWTFYLGNVQHMDILSANYGHRISLALHDLLGNRFENPGLTFYM